MTTETTTQPLDKTMKIEMEIWCSHPHEFHNLLALLQSTELCDYVNGKLGGYGFSIKSDQFTEKAVRKALGFKKSEVEVFQY